MQHAADLIRNRNIVDLIFPIGLANACTFIESSFPGRHYLLVSCKFILQSTVASHPQSLCTSLGQPEIFCHVHRARIVWTASSKQLRCEWQRIPAQMSWKYHAGKKHPMLSQDRLSCVVDKFRLIFLGTSEFALLLRLNRLSKQSEKIINCRSKMQELCALKQLNPQAAQRPTTRGSPILLPTTLPTTALIYTTFKKSPGHLAIIFEPPVRHA